MLNLDTLHPSKMTPPSDRKRFFTVSISLAGLQWQNHYVLCTKKNSKAAGGKNSKITATLYINQNTVTKSKLHRYRITHEIPRLRISSTQISPFPSKPHLFWTEHTRKGRTIVAEFLFHFSGGKKEIIIRCDELLQELTGLNFAAMASSISSSFRTPTSTSSRSSFFEIFHSCSL